MNTCQRKGRDLRRNINGGNISLIKVICETCGKDFEVPHWRIVARFCSPKCFYEWNSVYQRGKKNPSWKGGKIKKSCEICDRHFFVYLCGVNRKFCSWKCFGKWNSLNKQGESGTNWKGGDLVYWKRKVYKRDNYACRLCNSKENIETHHIYPKGKYPELKLYIDNIITLCAKCHRYFSRREESFIDFFERIKNKR